MHAGINAMSDAKPQREFDADFLAKAATAHNRLTHTLS